MRADTDAYGGLFDSVNGGVSDAATEDLWPLMRPIVEDRPVLEGEGGLFAELPVLPNIWYAQPETPSFLVTSFDGVAEVLRNSAVFSSAALPWYELLFGRAIVNTDGAEHSRYRSLVMPAMRKSTMDDWQDKYIVPTVERILAGLRGQETIDLVRDYAFPIPFLTTCDVIGLREEDQFEVTRLINMILNIAGDVESGFKASAQVRDYMAKVVEDHQANPRNDMVSDLLAADVDGQRLEFEEVVSFLRLLGPAAMDTTYRSMSNLLFALLSNPDQWNLLRDDRSLMPKAIEEGLRWETVGPFIPRVAVKDVLVEGVAIPDGGLVAVCAGMANRDHRRWEDPDLFDINRPTKAHHTFGGGPHMCLGFHLAKQVMGFAISRLLDEYPNIRLDESCRQSGVTGIVLRSPQQLPVVLN